MSYQTELLARLKDPEEGWPHFETPDFLQTLDDFADEVFTKGSVEGHLASGLLGENGKLGRPTYSASPASR